MLRDRILQGDRTTSENAIAFCKRLTAIKTGDCPMTSLVHVFKDYRIEQRSDDGFMNATAMCTANEKRIGDWLKSESAFEFLSALAENLSMDVPEINYHLNGNSIAARLPDLFPGLLLVKKGSPANGGGTWVHPDVAIQLAQWCSPKFAIQVSRWVREWMTAGKSSSTGDTDRRIDRLEDAVIQIAESQRMLIDSQRMLVDMVRSQQSAQQPKAQPVKPASVDYNALPAGIDPEEKTRLERQEKERSLIPGTPEFEKLEGLRQMFGKPRAKGASGMTGIDAIVEKTISF